VRAELGELRRQRLVVHLDNSEVTADAIRRIRIRKQDCAERDVARTAGEELNHVLRRRDTPHADDGKLRRRPARMHRGKCNRLQRWAGKSACDARKRRLQRARIEREAAQRVDQRQAVGARRFHGSCDRAEVGMRGGKLRVERQRRRRAARRDDVRRRIGGLVDVRAGEVQLDRVDVLERLARLRIVAAGKAADGIPRALSRGRWALRKCSRPGFASPIELSIPCGVSAIRGGAFPSRGSGVIVFVTKTSSVRATSGATSASRQPEALSSMVLSRRMVLSYSVASTKRRKDAGSARSLCYGRD